MEQKERERCPVLLIFHSCQKGLFFLFRFLRCLVAAATVNDIPAARHRLSAFLLSLSMDAEQTEYLLRVVLSDIPQVIYLSEF